MSFSLQSVLAAQTAGEALNLENENRRADAAMKMQQISTMKDNQAYADLQRQQQAQQQQQVTNLLADQQVSRDANAVANGTDPNLQAEQDLKTEADKYTKLGTIYAASDPATAQSWLKMADATNGKIGEVRKNNLEIAGKKAANTAAFAGSVLNGDVDPETAFKWMKDNVSVQDAMQIPTDPEKAKQFWRMKQTTGLTAQQQLENARQIQADKDKADAAEQAHQDRVDARLQRAADMAAQRELTRSTIASAAEARADKAADKAKDTDFKQSEKLNGRLAADAKPLLEDRRRMDQIDGLLEVNSSAADQQIHQALTAVMGNFKGRATNLFYRDNKNFGSVASRMSGFLSHSFTGRFQESDRQMIQSMVDDMKNNMIDPALANIEGQAKNHAKRYGLDPDNIEVQGDFNRDAKPAAPTYAEGQTARNPSTGAVMVFKQGKWVPQ